MQHKKLLFVVPPKRFHEHSPDPIDRLTFACPWRAMAKAKKWLLHSFSLWVAFGQHHSFFFQLEFEEAAILNFAEQPKLLCRWRLCILLQSFHPIVQSLAIMGDTEMHIRLCLPCEGSWSLFIWLLGQRNSFAHLH